MVRSHLDEQLGLRGRTVFGEGVFFDRVFVNGVRLRRGFEAAWAHGPVSVSGEYIRVTDERRGMGTEGESLPDVEAAGWYVSGTWLLTGETKQGRIEPRRSAFTGGIGALELAARFERLAFEPVSYPGTALGFSRPEALSGNAEHVTTLGVTWYLSRYVKLQGNLVVEAINDAQRSPAPTADGRFPSGVLLLQLSL
jgi:phosphate-selective porin